MTTTTLVPATIADLEQQPGRCELIDGEIIPMAPAGFEHGLVAKRLVRILDAYCVRTGIGEVVTCDPGFIWNGQTVRAPDVAVVRQADVARIARRGFIRFAPLLAAEVVSPNDDDKDVQAKAAGWIAHGAAVAWIADPWPRTLTIWQPGVPPQVFGFDDQIAGGDVLPGFACAVAAIFA
jgi:Uma2 family endonuclease